MPERLFPVALFLALAALITASTAQCPWDNPSYIKWSDWKGAPLNASTTVAIAAGQRILLDVAPAFIVSRIEVEGELIFADVDLELKVQFLFVHDGGHLWIGAPECPLTKNVTVTLYGLTQNPKSQPDLTLSNKVIGGLPGSNIDIHGRPRTVVWTNLAGTAKAGDTVIKVADAVDWTVGESIVIATTDYASYRIQNEVFRIKAITGKTITLSGPLLYTHYGHIWSPAEDPSVKIDMRAEVALLSRNLRIRGDVTQGTTRRDQWGGHIMSMMGDLRVSYAELTEMGQKDNLARYPIHWHNSGDRPQSYAKGNSIYNCFQRAMVIHGTNKLTIENNVAFNVSGLMYFLEDGNEINNVFVNNLGIQPNPHTLLKEADANPSVFWITNPSNRFVGNVAVGGLFGFWFAMPPRPTGSGPLQASYATTYPRVTPLLEFRNNKAHSTRNAGCHADDGSKDGTGTLAGNTKWSPRDFSFLSEAEIKTLGSQRSPDPDFVNLAEYTIATQGTPVMSVMDGFTSYKNGFFGHWYRGDSLKLTNSVFADNRFGVEQAGTNMWVENLAIVGETDNIGSWRDAADWRSRPVPAKPGEPLIGYRFYDNFGPTLARNIKFFNFYPAKLPSGAIRPAAALAHQGARDVITANNKFINLTMVNTQPAYFDYDQESFKQLATILGSSMTDFDGSITGTCGAEIVPDRSPPLYDSSCVHYPGWHAYVCPPSTRPHRTVKIINGKTSLRCAATLDELQPLGSAMFYRLSDKAKVELMQGEEFSTKAGQTCHNMLNWNVNAMTYTDYLVTFPEDTTPSSLKVNVGSAVRGEWIRFAIPYPSGTTFSIKGSGDFGATLKSATSLSGVSKLAYFYDKSTRLLHVELVMTGQTASYIGSEFFIDRITGITITARCPNGDCRQRVNPSTLTPTRTGNPTPNPFHCVQGGNEIGGRVSYAVKSTATSTVFDEKLRSPWTLYSGSAKLATDVVFAGSKAMRVTNSKLLTFKASTKVSAKKYTHLEFYARLAPKQGVLSVPLRVAIVSPLGGMVDAQYLPYSVTGGPIDDQKWSRIVIPLKLYGLNKVSSVLSKFTLSLDSPRQYVIYYDSIRFVSYTSKVTPFKSYSYPKRTNGDVSTRNTGFIPASLHS